nr:fanconi anemia group D2 protein [Ipomoea batatas]
MTRTRFMWFTLGFSSASALMAQFVFRDLLIDRTLLSSQLKEKFSALEGRVSSLETVLQDNPEPHQVSTLILFLHKICIFFC